MIEWLKWIKACPPLVLALFYLAPLVAFLYLGAKVLDKAYGLWLRYRHPKEVSMNYAERRALAAKRLANPSLYTQQANKTQKAVLQTNQRAEDSAIDRGLVAWWE